MKQNFVQVGIVIPVNHDGTNVHAGNLTVNGYYTKSGDFDIDWANWNGSDVLPLLKSFSPDAIETVKAALSNNLDNLNPFERFQMERYGNVLVSQTGIYGTEEHTEFTDRMATWADAKTEEPCLT